MAIEIFSDMINAVKEIARLAALPEEEREYYRGVVSETYELLHDAISLVRIRLGNLLQIDDHDVFIRELRGLDNLDEWIKIEQKVRLCHKLRAAGREMQGLRRRLRGRIAVRSWKDFRLLVALVLEREETLAEFIRHSLSHLASMSDGAARSSTGYEEAREAVRETKNAVDRELESLISAEEELYSEI